MKFFKKYVLASTEFVLPGVKIQIMGFPIPLKLIIIKLLLVLEYYIYFRSTKRYNVGTKINGGKNEY